MTEVRKSLKWTQPDALVEALSTKSCYVVLETSPPDYVEKLSRYLESSAEHNRQDDAFKDPAGAESDSGDSLFITQKPVPEAVRSQRRHRYSVRSDPTSPRDLEESEDDSSSSTPREEPKTDKRRGRKKCRLPRFSFPFLKDRKFKPRSTLLSVEQNTRLHYYAMGGFFKCVSELWQSYQSGVDLQLSVPTVDMDGQHIPPLSEDEEEREDIRVVERKRFVAPSKPKCSKPWYTPEKGDIEVKEQRRRGGSSAREEMSQERQSKRLHKVPAKASTSRATALSSDTESSDNEDPSHRPPAERETSDKQVRSDRSAVTQTEAPNTNRRLTRGSKKILFQEKESEQQLCDDSDATVCEALEQGGPREYTLNGREASPNVAEPQADVFHTDDLSQTGQEEDEPESLSLLQSLPELVSDTNNDRVCNKTRVKRMKKAKGDHESVEEEEKDQSREEPEGLRTAASVSVEAEETPRLSEDNPAEPPASQTSDEPELNEQNSSHDVPDSKQKKRKKKKAATDDVTQEEDRNVETDVRLETEALFSVTCDMVNGGKEKKKKKKRKRSVEDDEGVEQLLSSAVSEPVNEDAEIQRKKKKRKKEKVIVDTEEHEEEEALNMTSDRPLVSEGELEDMGNCLENTEAPQETLESGYEKKRKKHKKKQRSASHDDVQVGAEDCVDLSSSNGITLEGSTGQAVKKKKKKKRDSISEGVDISSAPDESTKVNNAENSQKTEEGPNDQDAELVSKKKKKKKKKKSEIFSRNVSEDAVTQSDDSVSVRKKEKNRTSSFLVADAEEKDAQTHEEQSSVCSTSAAAHVWAAEEPGETQSADSAGNLEASNDGVRKKKGRKRKTLVVQESVEEDHKQDFEEPNKTCQSALPETNDTEVKRKKKRKRNESESVTPMERLESSADAGCPSADEAVVLKKKKKKKKKKQKEESCPATQESPPAATDDAVSEGATLKTCSSVSHEKKDKRSTFALAAKEINGHSSEIISAPDEETKETLNMAEHASPSSETTGDPVSHDARGKKKKKKVKFSDNVLLERELSTESAETKTPKTKKKERNKPTSVTFTSSCPTLSQSEMSSSDCISKNRQKKAKRKLHNPCEDFLTDC